MKIIFIIITLLVLSSLSVSAQLVEHFENPQRFQFVPFEYEVFGSNYFLTLDYMTGDNRFSNDTVFLTKRCTQIDSTRLIYGLAIPIQFDNYHNNYLFNDTLEYLNWMLTHYDTSNSSVFIGVPTSRTGYDYSLLVRASMRIGESALVGNLFRMRDSDSVVLTLSHDGLYFPVLEVYFEQPISLKGDFVAGLNQAPAFYGIMAMPLSFFFPGHSNPMSNTGCPGTDTMFFSRIIDSSFVNVTHIEGPAPVYYYYTWSAPFPILTPPPCMPPIWLKVVEQRRQEATIQWRAQYSNSYFEVEYGPRGFAEGTGITLGPIAPDAQYNGHATLSGLTMDADYTVRVRSYCTTEGGYSDWAELDFHTDAYYIVGASANNDSWGYVVGGGEYLSGTTARLYAYPRSEYCPFLNWNDGSTQNPRVLTVTRDTSFLAVFGCDSVGIAAADGLPSVAVSPNPASAEVTLRSSQPIASWTLYDIQGRAVAAGQPSGTSATVDLRHLPQALYILSVRTAAGTIVKSKIIKN